MMVFLFNQTFVVNAFLCQLVYLFMSFYPF
jgi:hypothetical protein